MKNTGYEIQVVSEGAPSYSLLQLMVSQTYRDNYQADILPAPDCFIALKTWDNRWASCFGVTFAQGGTLFSERYLNAPIETFIEEKFQKEAQRHQLAECGSFASSLIPGGGKTLLASLPWILWTSGIHYALVTVIPQVQKLFQLLSIPFLPLCSADSNLLSRTELEAWGSYYNSNPITGIIDTRQGVINTLDARAGKYAIRSIAVNMPLAQAKVAC
jgi:hypothetical protein